MDAGIPISDMDREQLKQAKVILEREKSMKRTLVSETVADLIKFINENDPLDGFLHPPDKKSNPWIEKSKCTIV